MPIEAVDHTVVCLPKTLCDCGGKVQTTPENFRRHQQFKLPKIKPIVTEYPHVLDDQGVDQLGQVQFVNHACHGPKWSRL